MATSGLQPLLIQGPQTNPTSKRRRANSVDTARVLQHHDYTVGWICALPTEMAAAEAMLDCPHEALPQHDFDTNTYILGSISGHNIVIACLPKGQYGTNNAVSVSNHMARSFPRISYRFVVGIGGGAPSSSDIRLGDVVVSTDVIQYDLGKAMPDRYFHRIATPIRPPQALMTAVSKLQSRHSKGQNNMMSILLESTSHMPHYKHPMLQDRLFCSEYTHIRLADNCDRCDLQQLVHRDMRGNTDPVVHYGRIASGNQVIKDSVTRDQLSEDLGCICFEMESAGVMETFPCLAIRGICDYSDSHKNKEWQNYAAMVAASYAKELLTAIPIASVQPRRRQRVQESNISSPRNPDIDHCLRALVATDPAQDRQDILDAKGDICEGTCEWIFSTKQFKEWQQELSHLLWISAPPGMGKTYLAIFLSKHFERISNELPGTKTVFFFCDNQHETRSTAVNILRGLLDQLISFRRDLVYTIMPYWDQRSSQLFEDNSFSILWRLFEEMVEKSELDILYCVIDALEECEESSLIMLLRKLERHNKGTTKESTKVKFVCLSRRFPERIGEHFVDCVQIDLVTTSSRKEDIGRFISDRVRDLARKKKFNYKLQKRVEQIFQQKSEETFLWVSFMTMDLEKKRLMDIEASLDMLPSGLDAVYDKIISRIDQVHLDSIIRLLNWVLIATRPLRIPEICEILDITPTPLLSREIICLELIKLCGHLLRVSLNRNGWDFPFRDSQSRLRTESKFGLLSQTGFRSRPLNDQASGFEAHASETRCTMPHLGLLEPTCSERTTGSTPDDDIDYWLLEVTFLHQSARDYLTKQKMLSPLRTYDFCIPDLNQLATSQLTRYIQNVNCYSASRNTEQIKILQIMEKLPLASYAIENWHHHARECSDISSVIRQDSGFFDEVSESRALWQRLCTSVAWRFQGSSAIPLLHLSCIVGLENLAIWCVERQQTYSLDKRWGEGKTPLHEACDAKHEAIANILLDAGANALIMDRQHRNSVHYAIRKCSRELLSRMALQKRCRKWLRRQVHDPHSRLLHHAAKYGNEGACRFLLEDFAWDVNSKRTRLLLGQTPVMSALVYRHFKLAQTFISEWQAQFEDWRTLHGTITAFSRSKTEEMIRFLISDCFVDINTTDPAGHSILCSMFRNYTGWYYPDVFLSLLLTILDLGCNIDEPDNRGRTALHCSAMELDFSLSPIFVLTTKYLLRRGRLHANHACFDGQTILHHFIETFSTCNPYLFEGQLMSASRSVKGLLDMGVDRELRNHEGQSALDLLKRTLDLVDSRSHGRYKQSVDQVLSVLEDYSTVPILPDVFSQGFVR